ncbi:ribokinase [Youxingia wuxianensis]|uniref:Ribokinase n=1 Tax=Youxingia wuxianensis TaxID=2763678 RepID=A0A926ES64_9FIRM|nr:ribokinase [Youxingia wuxianensis]MBC8585369.1 ribokinase [Youxingia wuxianensis]
MKVLSYGSLNLDYVFRVDHFVRPGETMIALDRQVFPGGKGLNQSIALSRAGAQVYHAGAIGQDGEMLRRLLEENGVDTRYLRVRSQVGTGNAIIQVNRSGNNCILAYGGSNQTMCEWEAKETISQFEAGDFLVLQNEINEIGCMICAAHRQKMKIVLNPSPMNEKILDLPLELVDYFMINEVEAQDISGTNNPEDAMKALGEKYPQAKIVLTLGKLGVKYKDGEQVLSHGIYDVPVVDTTAAGDTFTGFFIGSIMQGNTPEEALRAASIASSIAVSRKGAAPSIPTWQEVNFSNLTLI